MPKTISAHNSSRKNAPAQALVASSSRPPAASTAKKTKAPSRSSERKRSESPASRATNYLLWAILLALVGLVGYTAMYLVTPHHGRGVPVRVQMPTPRTAESVSLVLYRAHVIDRPWLFSWLLLATGNADRLPEGFVPLRDDLTPRAVLRALASGRGMVRVTIPEGYNRFEIARRLAETGAIENEDEFVNRTQEPEVLARHGIQGDSLEGYLFPDTYDVPMNSTPDEVITLMVRAFRRRMDALRARAPEGLRRAERAGLDERGLLTLASLVEKETGAPEDRPRVAAVFWNRLTRPEFSPRFLQSDPTIVYGCRVTRPPSCPSLTVENTRPSITRAMIDDARNTYNTYKHTGLPPGPIANPGLRALEAVFAPAATNDLYFVSMGSNGRSAFAATLAEHQANVQRYLRNGSVRRNAPTPER